MTRSFSQICIAVLIVSALSASGRSQTGHHKNKEDGYGGFTVGAMNSDLGNLHSAMNTAGYGSFKNNKPFFGWMGYKIINDRVMLGYWTGFNEGSVESQLNQAKMYYGTGFVNAGYAVMNAKHYKLIPFVGVGGGGYVLNLRPIDQGSPAVHDVLTDPRRTASMTAGYIALELGLNNHFMFKVFDKLEDKAIRTYRVGGNFRMGMFYPVARCDWRFWDLGEFGERDNVFKGPATESKPTFYASLTVLFGNSSAKAPGEKTGKVVIPGQNEAPQDSTGQQ
jgi:hypothetical protein